MKVLTKVFAVAAATLAIGVGAGPASARPLPGPVPTPAASAPATMAHDYILPTSCVGEFHRATTTGEFGWAYVTGNTVKAGITGPMRFGGAVVVPKTMSYVRNISSSPLVNQYMAILPDGSMWSVRTQDRSSVTTTRVAASGWGGIRLIASPRDGVIYALNTSGGLARYSISTTGAASGTKVIATSGWAGVRDLTWAPPVTLSGVAYDRLRGLSGGSLVDFRFVQSTGAARSTVLAASGWSGIVHISVGECLNTAGSPMLGVSTSRMLYLYHDRSVNDFVGSDIRGAGSVGRGYSGLNFD